MQSQNKIDTFHIALLSAYAVGLHGIEALIPTPVPWLRIGLANIITLTTLLLYGFRAGMTVTLIRIFLGSFLRGTFLGPAFVLSLGGGVSSTVVMWLAHTLFKRLLSPIGLSLLGAVTHNIAQLFLAYLFFVRRPEAIIIISPVILLLGTITGAFNGVITGLIMKRVTESGRQKTADF
ncbi:MAG: Gx transporter family protein [Nitrospirae bacterium]|nr:Gx transporter family protein [Nitrospirota bacterium]